MKTQILKLLQLKQLYERSACGEKYTNIILQKSPQIPLQNNLESAIKNCSLCNRVKYSKEPSIGLFNPQASLCFISEISLIDEKGYFVQNKSAIMLENIIKRVFQTPFSNVCILSLIKCNWNDPHVKKSEISACIGFCFSQLHKIAPKISILLGKQVAEHILGSDLEGGRILWHNNKKFLITYSLNEVVRNPSLKAEVYNHLLMAKGEL